MKKFQFSLETVLTYKNEVLEALQGEHAILLGQVHEQEERLDKVVQWYQTYNEEYRMRKQEGMTILDAMEYEQGLRVLESDIQRETLRLEDLKAKEEKKRAEVVQAKVETSSLDKLKEKKLGDYQKAVQKDEEQKVEEFVSTTRVMARNGA
jgi:flagellar FliJ protein